MQATPYLSKLGEMNSRTAKRARKTAAFVAVVGLLLTTVSQAHSCALAIGYFHQVTALKGRVVGANSHLYPRWLRQSFAKKHAKLALFEYRSPSVRTPVAPIKTVETDISGMFDFGPLSPGHYTLTVNDEDSFDVEVKKPLENATETVTIDVSPILPDCTGGHEFIVKTKR